MFKQIFPYVFAFDLAECTYNGRSYLITYNAGNIIVDSPDHSKQTVDEIRHLDGISCIFITHADDVGDSTKFKREFGARIAIHGIDGWAVDADLKLRGGENILGYAKVIHIPGHTPVSSMLLAKLEKNYLFTGDTLLTTAGGKLWPDISVLTRNPKQVKDSIAKLMSYDFDVILLAHGARAAVEGAKTALKLD